MITFLPEARDMKSQRGDRDMYILSPFFLLTHTCTHTHTHTEEFVFEE